MYNVLIAYNCTLGIFFIKYFSGKLCLMLYMTLSHKAHQWTSKEETIKNEAEMHVGEPKLAVG